MTNTLVLQFNQVVALSLMFMRMHSFGVTARQSKWKERVVFTWASLIWFTSFHRSGSTMLVNMRNMLLESIDVLFLVARSDVSQSRQTTSEGNEQAYGTMRGIQREFNMEQLVRIADKMKIKWDAIFDSDLATSSSNVGKGHLYKTSGFVNSIKAAAEKRPPVGPVDVDLKKPAFNQL